MYQALVWVCLMSNPAECITLEDQRGPYKTYERCESRAYEMSRAVHIHMKGYKPNRWSCRGLANGQLTK